MPSETTTLLPSTAAVAEPDRRGIHATVAVSSLRRAALGLGVVSAIAATLVHGRLATHAGGMIFFFSLATLGTAIHRMLPHHRPFLLPRRAVQGLHGAVWTLAAVVAGHAALVMHHKHHPLGWHGGLGYTLLALLVVQYLLGGRALSLTPRTWDTTGTDDDPPPPSSAAHGWVQWHRAAGAVLYLALGTLLASQLLVHRWTTAFLLVTLSTILTLYGLVV